jgi:uncharacterized membrane protein YhdT
MNLEKYLLLNCKNVLIIIMAWFVAFILHNAIYAIFNFEEPVFFLLAVIVIPLYFIVSVSYTIINSVKKK